MPSNQQQLLWWIYQLAQTTCAVIGNFSIHMEHHDFNQFSYWLLLNWHVSLMLMCSTYRFYFIEPFCMLKWLLMRALLNLSATYIVTNRWSTTPRNFMTHSIPINPLNARGSTQIPAERFSAMSSSNIKTTMKSFFAMPHYWAINFYYFQLTEIAINLQSEWRNND